MEKDKRNRVHWASPAAWILLACFTVSFATLIIYLEESQFSDEILFLLLAILRYSSFLVCILAVYKIILNIFSITRERLVALIKIIFYMLFLIYGAGIIFLESLIVVAAGGN
jgi:hypothetical protein